MVFIEKNIKNIIYWYVYLIEILKLRLSNLIKWLLLINLF